MVLLYHEQYSLLPDILEIFGDRAAEFLDTFGGQTITIPKADEIWKSGEDVKIFVTLYRASGKSAEEVKELIDTLAVRTDRTKVDILSTYKKVRKIVRKHPRYRNIQDAIGRKAEEDED